MTTQQTQTQNGTSAQDPSIDLTQLKTPSGKSVSDFEVPKKLLEKDQSLTELIMRSESMNDSERQYWFSLTEVMTPEQVEKLRDILTRERQKLAEIEKRYGRKKEVKLSPEEIRRRNEKMRRRREEQKKKLREKEEAAEKEEAKKEEAILKEFEEL